MTRVEPERLARPRMRGQPLVFLATVLLLWTGARIVHHVTANGAPAASLRPGQSGTTLASSPLQQVRVVATASHIPSSRPAGSAGSRVSLLRDGWRTHRGALHSGNDTAQADPDFETGLAHHLLWAEALTSGAGMAGRSVSPLADTPIVITQAPAAHQPGDAAASIPTARPADKRWSVYGWSLVRQGSGVRTLAPAAQYGGSQAGAVVRYAFADAGFAPGFYIRATAALASSDDRTLAFGLSARPWRGVPLDLAVERRLGLADGQADRFAALVVAGGGGTLGRSDVRIEAYGQAGIVGWMQPQGFFDLQAVGTRALITNDRTAVTVGGGLWAGGQQEVQAGGGKAWVHRVDLGPRAALTLPAASSQMTLALDWRQRIDGEARPGSGAALTLSADF